MRSFLMFLAVAFGSANAEAQWTDRSGKAVPETSDRRSVDGFSGHLLITPDKDWQDKWNTPPEATPEFASADTLVPGDEVQILIFFSNARRGAGNTVRVRCDLQVIRPDGTFAANAQDVACFDHAVSRPLGNIYMADVSLKFIAEPEDPPGRWTVRTVLRDELRDTELPLEASFELKVP